MAHLGPKDTTLADGFRDPVLPTSHLGSIFAKATCVSHFRCCRDQQKPPILQMFCTWFLCWVARLACRSCSLIAKHKDVTSLTQGVHPILSPLHSPLLVVKSPHYFMMERSSPYWCEEFVSPGHQAGASSHQGGFWPCGNNSPTSLSDLNLKNRSCELI